MLKTNPRIMQADVPVKTGCTLVCKDIGRSVENSPVKRVHESSVAGNLLNCTCVETKLAFWDRP